MRVMAVDYGDARTGVAVSDLTRTLAGDAWVIQSKNMQEIARKIADEAASRDVSCIIVGHPKNMDGSLGESARKSEQLAEIIMSLCRGEPQPAGEESRGGPACPPAEKPVIEVKLWDERLTTVSANKILSDAGKRKKKQKQTVDAVAASLILESYLDSL